MKEPWNDVWDEQHPIRWTPANDVDLEKYITLKGAAERLARDATEDGDEDAANVKYWTDKLNEGVVLRTEFAYYAKLY